MLDSLITSKTRLKLLMKFFLNSQTTGYLRHLAAEFDESTNGIRQELNHLEEAKLLESELVQNKKVFRANTAHPYYMDIHKLLLKYVGIEQLVDQVVKRVGQLQSAFIINDFAQGKPGLILDLVLVGANFDKDYLNTLIQKAEEDLRFKIRYVCLQPDELEVFLPDYSQAIRLA